MESEERQALSIDSQVKEMYKIAERDKLSVVIVLTEAHSAKDSGQRPIFNQMMIDVKNGKFNAILTWAPDRLSRNAGDLGQLVDLMDSGVLLEIRTYGQTFSNSPNEKFLLMILCSQAKLENDNKSVNVKRGLRMTAERGYRPGVANVGYLNAYRTDRPGEVLVDELRASIVRMMFEKAANGWSHRRIAQWLRDINFTTKNGTYLYLSTIQSTLVNTFYYGEFEYPKGSGAWHKGKHIPLITKKLFDQVQIQLALRRTDHKSNRKSFAYTRLMKCGHCGSGISAQEKFKRLKDGSFSRYVYYGCNHSRSIFCKNTYLREELLVRQLTNLLDHLSLDELGIREQLSRETERLFRFHNDVMGLPNPESQEKKDVDIKTYAKYLLNTGTIEEKRRLLCNLKSKLIMKDRAIYLDMGDTENIQENPENQTTNAPVDPVGN